MDIPSLNGFAFSVSDTRIGKFHISFLCAINTQETTQWYKQNTRKEIDKEFTSHDPIVEKPMNRFWCQKKLSSKISYKLSHFYCRVRHFGNFTFFCVSLWLTMFAPNKTKTSPEKRKFIHRYIY
jgi:hypothetical protein